MATIFWADTVKKGRPQIGLGPGDPFPVGHDCLPDLSTSVLEDFVPSFFQQDSKRYRDGCVGNAGERLGKF